MRMFPRHRSSRRGTGVILIVGLIAVLGFQAASLLHVSLQKYQQGARLRGSMALQHLLEGAAERARAELRRSPGYAGANRLPLGGGEVRIVVEKDGQGGRRIQLTAAAPDLAAPHRIETRTIVWRPVKR